MRSPSEDRLIRVHHTSAHHVSDTRMLCVHLQEELGLKPLVRQLMKMCLCFIEISTGAVKTLAGLECVFWKGSILDKQPDTRKQADHQIVLTFEEKKHTFVVLLLDASGRACYGAIMSKPYQYQ